MDTYPVILEFWSPVELEILGEEQIGEEKGLNVKVLWQRAEFINSNRRRYRRELLQREINHTMESINRGDSIWGAAFHPGDGLGKPQDISHIWTKVWMNQNGVCEGNLTILPTPAGKNIMTLIKAGKLGMSSRGFGTVTEKEEKIGDRMTKFLDVNDDYKMSTPGDWVVAPSVEGAGNLGEQITLLESKLNEGLDPIKTDDKMENTMNLEQLKKEHPELVKQIEDEKEQALKVESDKTVGEKDTKITELEADIKTLTEEKTTLTEQVKTLGEKVDGYINFLRELISKTGEQPDVLEGDGEDEDEEGSKEKPKSEKEKAETNKKLDDANKKIADLEKKEKDREDAENKAEADKELQTNLSTALNETLEKEEYKVLADLIKAEVTDEDGKINIESVEVVEDVVKAAFEKISNLKAELEKKNILAGGVDEKGNVPNPEGGSEEVMNAKLRKLYQEAKAGDFRGTFEEWKEKYPLIVEQVKG